MSDVKLFAVIVNWAKVSASALYSDQWKMSFNPDRAKQAQEVIFLRKT